MTFAAKPQLDGKSKAGPAPTPPNIVLILADDMGFSDIGCYGGEIETSNLDALAANGLRFTQFYNGARCCPTRAALLTGLYSHQAGMGGMEPDWGEPGYRGNLNRQCVTIAEALKGAGYAAWMSGKWHLTNKTRAREEADKFNWPRQRGFDRFYGTIAGAGNFFTPNTLTRDNAEIGREPRDAKGYYYTDAISDETVRFIREHAASGAAKPFFSYVAYTAPHWPLHAKPGDIAKYKGRYDGGWDKLREERLKKQRKLGLFAREWELSKRTPWVPAWEALAEKKMPKPLEEEPTVNADNIAANMARRMEVYAAQVDAMDQGIGRIVAELERQGMLENTLLVFLADNGGCSEYGVHGFTRGDRTTAALGSAKSNASYGGGWANASNTPFRYFKHDIYEGGIATPLIVHWPAGIRGKGVFRRQVGHIIDLMPTFLEVAGAEYPREFEGFRIMPLEGVSLMSAFADRELDRENPVFWEHHGNRGVRDHRWKLVAAGESGDWELYDMEVDRTETTNLASELPAMVRKLGDKWQYWAMRANVLPMNPNRKKKADSKSARAGNARMNAAEPKPGNLAALRIGQSYPKARASWTSRFDKVWEVHDSVINFRPGPRNRWTSYQSTSTTDWVEIDFGEVTAFGRATLHIYDDRGGVQAPRSYDVQYMDGAEWKSIPGQTKAPTTPAGGQANEVEFPAVESSKLRVVFTHKGGPKSGLTELEVWKE